MPAIFLPLRSRPSRLNYITGVQVFIKPTQGHGVTKASRESRLSLVYTVPTWVPDLQTISKSLGLRNFNVFSTPPPTHPRSVYESIHCVARTRRSTPISRRSKNERTPLPRFGNCMTHPTGYWLSAIRRGESAEFVPGR